MNVGMRPPVFGRTLDASTSRIKQRWLNTVGVLAMSLLPVGPVLADDTVTIGHRSDDVSETCRGSIGLDDVILWEEAVGVSRISPERRSDPDAQYLVNIPLKRPIHVLAGHSRDVNPADLGLTTRSGKPLAIYKATISTRPVNRLSILLEVSELPDHSVFSVKANALPLAVGERCIQGSIITLSNVHRLWED